MNAFTSFRWILQVLHLQADLSFSVPLFVLLTVRLAAACSFVPFFGGEAVPRRIRVGMSIAFAGVLYPSVATPLNGPKIYFGLFLALLAKEVLVGSVIGILVRIVFAAVESTGYLVEFAAGLRPGAVLAPELSSEASLLGQLLGQASIVFCLTAGLHLAVLRSLADSYVILPLLQTPAPAQGFLEFARMAGKLTTGMLALTAQLSAPILFGLLLINLGGDLVIRISALRVQSHPLQPISSLVLFGGVFLASGLILDEAWRFATFYLGDVRDFLTKLGQTG